MRWLIVTVLTAGLLLRAGAAKACDYSPCGWQTVEPAREADRTKEFHGALVGIAQQLQTFALQRFDEESPASEVAVDAPRKLGCGRL